MPEDVRRRYHHCHRRHASSRASAHNSSKALYRPSCVVSSPCAGPSDTVCEVSFSDGIKWAVHIPTEGDVCSPSRTRSFYLDMVTQCFISSKSHANTSDSLLVLQFQQHSISFICHYGLHMREESRRALERPGLDHRPQVRKHIRADCGVDDRACRIQI